MGIIRFGIWGPKPRSVNNLSQRSDFGNLGTNVANGSVYIYIWPRPF